MQMSPILGAALLLNSTVLWLKLGARVRGRVRARARARARVRVRVRVRVTVRVRVRVRVRLSVRVSEGKHTPLCPSEHAVGPG